MKNIWDNFTYFFRRKYNQIERTLDFLPIIWKGFDFDYNYSIELFKHQLTRQAKFMESNSAHTMGAKNSARRIRTAIELMTKVYDDDYGMEFQDKLKKLYGDNVLDWRYIPIENKPGLVELKHEFDFWDNKDEIQKVYDKLFMESNDKQKRAHTLLWKFIEHNICSWWD